jgi:hypothetical protein
VRVQGGCRGIRAGLAALAAAALASGCARAPAVGREPFADAPVQTLTADEVRRRLDSAAAEVTSLRGTLVLELRRERDRGFRSCRGALAARSPWQGGAAAGLYLRGHVGPAPALFTLVSDGRAFWLHVPRDAVVYTGAIAHGRAAPGEREVPLDVADLFRGLFVQPVPPGAEVEVAEEPEAWVVSVRREGRIRRKAWLDRRGLVVRREVYLDAAGVAELTVERDGFRAREGRRHPARVELTDGRTGSAVRLGFETVVLDPPDLDARAFRPLVPPDARVERVAADGEGT